MMTSSFSANVAGTRRTLTGVTSCYSIAIRPSDYTTAIYLCDEKVFLTTDFGVSSTDISGSGSTSLKTVMGYTDSAFFWGTHLSSFSLSSSSILLSILLRGSGGGG
jgi:hypothetical protein